VDCPFCLRLRTGALIAENDLAAAFPDHYPLNPGHTLVIPRRHESNFFALTDAEQSAIWNLARALPATLSTQQQADGYNVGINIGMAAGQTVEHAHLHVIPRYSGDVPDPRGGVRWIIPAKAAYWEQR
jgi:diadenosine tetraphosphate (Ap4A) HIT family hydrolase